LGAQCIEKNYSCQREKNNRISFANLEKSSHYLACAKQGFLSAFQGFLQDTGRKQKLFKAARPMLRGVAEEI